MTDAEVILTYRLPSRMRELYAFITLAPAIRSATGIALQLDNPGTSFVLSHASFLAHPLADSAVLMARALLHFLGLGLDGKRSRLAPAVAKSSDVTMAHVGLSPLLPAKAVSGWAMPSGEAEDLLKLCIRTGNKVSGHLTVATALTLGADIDRLVDAFRLVNDLVNREVYAALERPAVEFSETGPHGYIGRVDSV